MFSSIIAPMIFFGCAYYPWRGLDASRCEIRRSGQSARLCRRGDAGALTPGVPHMPLTVVSVALLVLLSVFWTFGLRAFMKRAVG